MTKAARWWSGSLLAISALWIAQAERGHAQEAKARPGTRVIEVKDVDPKLIEAALAALLKDKAKEKLPFPKHDGAALNSSLRDVINAGVKMFNDQGDHAGCYRLYQGSLLSVRPFLVPELQKKVDAGIANAETMRTYADRAFELRRVLDEIRATLPAAKTAAAQGDKAQVSGRVTFEGRPIAGGYFVTLVGADGKKFSSTVQKDGTFSFKTAITPGAYRVVIEPIPSASAAALPKRFASESASGISVSVQSGKSRLELNLVN